MAGRRLGWRVLVLSAAVVVLGQCLIAAVVLPGVADATTRGWTGTVSYTHTDHTFVLDINGDQIWTDSEFTMTVSLDGRLITGFPQSNIPDPEPGNSILTGTDWQQPFAYTATLRSSFRHLYGGFPLAHLTETQRTEDSGKRQWAGTGSDPFRIWVSTGGYEIMPAFNTGLEIVKNVVTLTKGVGGDGSPYGGSTTGDVPITNRPITRPSPPPQGDARVTPNSTSLHSKYVYRVPYAECAAGTSNRTCHTGSDIVNWQITRETDTNHDGIPDRCDLLEGKRAGCPQSSITVSVQTDPMDLQTQFSFTGATAGNITDGRTLSHALAPGSYSVTEHDPGGWHLSGIQCTSPFSADLATGTASFTITPSTLEQCVFYMALIKPPYNEVQQTSSHNSYERNETIDTQLTHYLDRTLEFDIHPVAGCDPNNATICHPAFAVFHNFGDLGTHNQPEASGDVRCTPLSVCLDDLKEFDQANPHHEVVTIWLDAKTETDGPGEDAWTDPNNPTLDLRAAFDTQVRSALGTKVFTPRDLLNNCDRTRQDLAMTKKPVAIASELAVSVAYPCGWPNIDDPSLQGKFIFVLTSAGYYKAPHTMLNLGDPAQDSVAFVSTEDLNAFGGTVRRDGTRLSPYVFFNMSADLSHDTYLTARAEQPNGIFSTYPDLGCGSLAGDDNEAIWDGWRVLGVQQLGTNCINTDTPPDQSPWASTIGPGGWPFTVCPSAPTLCTTPITPTYGPDTGG